MVLGHLSVDGLSELRMERLPYGISMLSVQRQATTRRVRVRGLLGVRACAACVRVRVCALVQPGWGFISLFDYFNGGVL